MSDINIAQAYAPSQAEDGKFVPIDATLLTTMGYPATGTSGKFALLTYQVGGTATLPTSASNDLSDSTYNMTSSYGASTINVVTPSSTIASLEIYNNSANLVYLSFTTPATYTDLKNLGLIINPSGFYQIDRRISSFVIGADAISNLRIFGHYKA